MCVHVLSILFITVVLVHPSQFTLAPPINNRFVLHFTVMRLYKDMYLDTVMSLASRATCNHAKSTFTQVAYQRARVLLESQ